MKLIDRILATAEFNGNFCIIGIDGPTASGKTTLADALQQEFLKKNIPCIVYRLDWTLCDRKLRMNDLKNLVNKKCPFEYETSLHMDLSKAADFLKKVEQYRYKNFIEKEINLYNLYNRDDEGRCTGKQSFLLKRNMIVVVEGHYTHHHLLRRYFDMNYMLTAHAGELLKRKKLRVAGYRKHQTAEDYFNLVDIPSFRHYYFQNKAFIKDIYLNESFIDQVKLTSENTEHILFPISDPDHLDLSPDVYIVPPTLNGFKDTSATIRFFFSQLNPLHAKLVALWGVKPEYRETSFTEQIKLLSGKIGFRLAFTSFDPWQSNLFHYQFGIENDDFCFLVLGNLKEIKVLSVSDFSWQVFVQQADTTKSKSATGFELYQNNNTHIGRQHIIVPNHFLIPCCFQDKKNFTHIFYEKELHFGEQLSALVSEQSFFAFKTKDRKKKNFYNKLFKKTGFQTFFSLNYIFACNIQDKKVQTAFEELKRRFQPFKPHESKPDKSISSRELSLAGLIHTDGHFIFSSQLNPKLLIQVYKKASPEYRNKITKAISIQYPDLLFDQGVTSKDYINCLPVPLQEFYFALSLSGRGALPFISIYHSSGNSIDIQTYINYFFKAAKPFGLQASMNALGTAGMNIHGYLHINGPQEFSRIIKENIIGFIKNHPGKQIPPWGLGIDHAASHFDNCIKGLQFIKEAHKTEWITSYCIDPSGFYSKGITDDANKKTSKFLNKTLQQIGPANKDLEFYIGNEAILKNAPYDIVTNVYKKIVSIFYQIACQKTRHDCYLLGPFLGTQHHQSHDKLQFDISEKIFQACTDYGFAGNVLHGTSFTPFQDISEIIKRHCIRINYAGKLLESIVIALPEEARNFLGKTQKEQKQRISAVPEETIFNAQKNIAAELHKTLRKIENCGLDHAMNKEETDWFRNDGVCLSTSDFKKIVNSIYRRNKTIVKKTRATYLASMIEVPLKDFTGGLTERIIKAGITDFHIDFGDGQFISRTLDGFDKLEYLKENFPHINTHVHLMVKNPFGGTNGSSLIRKICNTKKSTIYLHRESFDQLTSWKKGAEMIIKMGSQPGVVLTVSEKTQLHQFLNKMKTAGIHNLLVMGVPIGRGGQEFHHSILQKIREIKMWEKSCGYEIIIEVDGGLSDAVTQSCIQAGATYLSGWSLFLKYGVENIEKRIAELIHGYV